MAGPGVPTHQPVDGPVKDDAGPLADGRRALTDGRWSDAVELFERAAAAGGTPATPRAPATPQAPVAPHTPVAHAGAAAAWDGVADAAWWLDDGVKVLEARERAYRAHRDAGDDLAAARTAANLGYDAALFGQGVSVASGWLGRARRLVRGHEDSAAAGWVSAREAEFALNVAHDSESALRAAQRAREAGGRLGDEDLEVVGEALEGLALAMTGRVADGIARLDAAAAAALAGDVVDVMWVGKIWCWLISASVETHDLGRAAQWCERVEELCRARDLAPLFNACRVRHASVQVAQGEWAAAEQELLGVLEHLLASRRASRADAVVQLGELRRRQGRLEEAEALYAQAEFDRRAVVGRALVQADRGDAEGAWTALAEVLHEVPETEVVLRAGLLLPAVVIAAAAGDPEAAAACAAELRRAAAVLGSDTLRAWSAAAEARVGPEEEAVGQWRRAVQAFQEAGLTFDEAEARVELATHLQRHGDSGTGEQLASALATFEQVGASGRATRARALVGRLSREGRGRSPLTPREQDVLRLVARGFTTGQVAAQLVLSEHTVHRHVANALAHLDASTRAAAVARATAEGWL